MSGVNRVASTQIQTSPSSWWNAEIGAIADLNGDGKLDILWRSPDDGQNLIWYMNLPAQTTAIGTASLQPVTDLDWRIVGAGQFNGDANPDLYWRHATLGWHACWFLSGANVIGTGFTGAVLDSDWRIAGQDNAESTWRLTRIASDGKTSHGDFWATVADYPSPVINLFFDVPPPPSGTWGITLSRRVFGTTNWTVLRSDYHSTTYSDTTVAVGVAYEYQAIREDFTPPGQPPDYPNRPYELRCGIKLPEKHQRGRVLLVLDRTLTNALAASLNQFEADLIGDGWAVTRITGERHEDARWSVNVPSIRTLKQAITSAYAQDPANTKGIVIVGHAVVPYSGWTATDGHEFCVADPPSGPDHRGAWSADLYYADIHDSAWTNDVLNRPNCVFPENTNLPNDGKWDTDYCPTLVEMFVGRIDFGRLPAFTQTSPVVSEVELLQRYFAKNHRFRLKQAPYPCPDKAAAIGSWGLDGGTDVGASRVVYSTAREAVSAMFGDWMELGRLVVRDAAAVKAQPHVWGFSSGAGLFDRIHFAQLSQHTAMDFKQSGTQVGTVFSVLTGSFFGDFNGTDDLMRAAVSASDYGLATLWAGYDGRYSPWRLGGMGVGDTLGDCLVRMINTPQWSARTQGIPRERWHNIIGDPTLRLYALSPATGLVGSRSGGGVQLAWTASPEAAIGYRVYRAPTTAGPFTLLTPALVTGTNYYHTNHPAMSIYMVRAAKLRVTGSGSFTNLSQGVTTTVP
jgi:hypothetical protein